MARLPCNDLACDRLSWFYSRDQSGVVREVKDGQVLTSSPRSQRLSLTEDCSLLIHKVVAEDGGYFVCESRQQERTLVLMVMTCELSHRTVSTPVGLPASRFAKLGPSRWSRSLADRSVAFG